MYDANVWTGPTTNEVLTALGFTKKINWTAGLANGAKVYRGDTLVFEGTLSQINEWLRQQSGCPEGF